MSFERKWKNFQRLTEAMEKTPFSSKAQQRYKKQRRKNDIYTTKAGHQNLKVGGPFTTRVKRAGSSRLRFEALKEKVDQDAL